LSEIGVETVFDHEQALLMRFLDGVGDIPGIEAYGRYDVMRMPVVSLNLGEIESSVLAERLAADHGIATRAGLHCAPRMHAALETLGTGAVRFSFNWFTGEEDISYALFALRSIAGAL
ncbi:MAG: aminotransferase class V-fold PLP-dependent enzyme, partial [Atopobiaceae bacterium]|nr:aminotransferase class V-fold PLP-dependent enzyme [Atopobiaceae bacterium]